MQGNSFSFNKTSAFGSFPKMANLSNPTKFLHDNHLRLGILFRGNFRLIWLKLKFDPMWCWVFVNKSIKILQMISKNRGWFE
jgi:hypothetical protein